MTGKRHLRRKGSRPPVLAWRSRRLHTEYEPLPHPANSLLSESRATISALRLLPHIARRSSAAGADYPDIFHGLLPCKRQSLAWRSPASPLRAPRRPSTPPGAARILGSAR